VVLVLGPDGVRNLGRRQHAGLRAHGHDLDAAEGGGAARLGEEDVGVGVGDDLLSLPRTDQHADEVAHGSAGHEEGGLLAEPLGGDLLEAVDGRVLAEDIVAQLGVGHGPAHLRAGHGEGVGAKVDDRQSQTTVAVT